MNRYFLYLIQSNAILTILLFLISQLFFYFKTKKLVKSFWFFILAFIFTNMFFLFLEYTNTSLVKNIIITKVLVVLHSFFHLFIIVFFIYSLNKEILKVFLSNKILLVLIFTLVQVYNFSNFLKLKNIQANPIIVLNDKIFKNQDNTVFYGPYLFLPNGFFNVVIDYNVEEKLTYNITLLSGKLYIRDGKLFSGNTVGTNSILLEKSLGRDFEIILHNNVPSKNQTRINNYTIYPTHIFCYLVLSFLDGTVNALIYFILLGLFLYFLRKREIYFKLGMQKIGYEKLISYTFIVFFLSLIIFKFLGFITFIKVSFLTYFFIFWLSLFLYVFLLLPLKKKNIITKELIFIILIFMLLLLSIIQYGFPQINIQHDEEDIVKGILAFLNYPDILHSNKFPYFFPHHYSSIHLHYLLVYPISLIVEFITGLNGVFVLKENPYIVLLLARFSSLLFGVLSIILIFLISKKVFQDEKVATFSSLILTTSIVFFAMSNYAKIETMMMFGILGTIYFSLVFLEDGKMSFLFISIISAAFASSSRINFVLLLILPVFTYFFRSFFVERKRLKEVLLYFLLFALVFFVSFIVFLPNMLVISQYIIDSFFSEATRDNIDIYKKLYHYVYEGIFLYGGITFPLLFITSIPFVFFSKNLNKTQKLCAMLVLSVGVVNLVILLIFGKRAISRYSMFFIPVVAIFSAYLILKIKEKTNNLIFFLILVFLFSFSLQDIAKFIIRRMRKPIAIKAREWIAQNVKPEEKIGVLNLQLPYHRIVLPNYKIKEVENGKPITNYDYFIVYVYTENQKNMLSSFQGVEFVTNFDAEKLSVWNYSIEIYKKVINK